MLLINLMKILKINYVMVGSFFEAAFSLDWWLVGLGKNIRELSSLTSLV